MKRIALLAALVIVPLPVEASMTWQGQLSCGVAAWVMPGESVPRGPFVRSVEMASNGAALSAQPRWPAENPRVTISERWTGSIIADSVLVLVNGEATSGERWTYTFRGRLYGNGRIMLEGQQSRDGRPFRDCRLRLDGPGVR